MFYVKVKVNREPNIYDHVKRYSKYVKAYMWDNQTDKLDEIIYYF